MFCFNSPLYSLLTFSRRYGGLICSVLGRFGVIYRGGGHISLGSYYDMLSQVDGRDIFEGERRVTEGTLRLHSVHLTFTEPLFGTGFADHVRTT